MKIFSIILIFIMFGCSQSKDVSKTDICGKEFKKEENIDNVGMTVTHITILNCDGTFQSGTIYSQVTEGILSNRDDEYKGKWEIVKEISNDIKEKVIQYGVKNDDYSIIKYSSNNGIDGYCLYYKQNGYYILDPLYLDQIPMSKYEHSGSLGIWDGFQE